MTHIRLARVVQYCRPESSRILLLSIGKPEVSWCKVLPSVWIHWTRIDSDGKVHWPGQIKDCLRRDCQLRSSILFPYESRGGSSDFWLPTSTSDFRLPTSDLDFILQTSDFRLDKVRTLTPDFWFLTVQSQSWMLDLRTSRFPLLTSDFRLPTSDFRLLTFDFRFPTSDFSLPTSHFRLPTSDFPLLISKLPTSDLTLLFGSIAARSTKPVLKLKVKAQWKGRLYRSRHKREQLKLLLKKQPSNHDYQGRKYPLQSKD